MDIANGQFAFTTVNGDTISGTYSGVHKPTSMPSILEIDGEAYITAGSGRFKGVTGAGVLSGTLDLATVKVTLVLQGAMTSVAAAKE